MTKKIEMIKIFIVVTVFTCFTLIACNDKKESSKTRIEQQSHLEQLQQQYIEQRKRSITDSDTNVSTVADTLPTGPIGTEVKLNPPHGQPGHRCEIAVGSPLNSPATNQAPAPAPEPVVRLNPPHGQPGHSCDVPVGSPLK